MIDTNATPPPEKKLANIDENQVNTNQQLIPVPYMAGRQRVALIWIAPVYNPVTKKVEQKVGKGEKQTVGYIYFGDIAGIPCMGGRAPLAKLFRHIIDSEIAWENSGGLSLSSGANPVTVKDRGQTWLYPGTADQPIDTHVLTPVGATPSDPGFNPRIPTTWPDSDLTTRHPEP
jgi:hypothetical protein